MLWLKPSMIFIEKYAKLAFLIGVLTSLCCNTSRAAALRIPLLSQYDYPPYLISETQGLNQDLATYLSNASQGRYQFELQTLPKKRLMLTIQRPHWHGIVPWVMPAWLQDTQRNRFHWSKVILEDGDRVLSLPTRALEWQGPGSLYGLRFGGVLGHYYSNITPDIDAGKIQRDDAPNMLSNIKKLGAGRVDAIFIPELLYRYLAQQDPQFSKTYYVSKNWLAPQRNQLRIMSGLENKDLAVWLDQQVQVMKTDTEWQKLLKKYGLSSPH